MTSIRHGRTYIYWLVSTKFWGKFMWRVELMWQTFFFFFVPYSVMLTLSSMALNFDRMQVFLGSKNSKLISKLKSSSQEKKIPRKFAPYWNGSTLKSFLSNHSFSNCQKRVENYINWRNKEFVIILKVEIWPLNH